MISGRRRSVIFFTVLGVSLVALALTLNISWLVLSWERAALAVLGLVFFLVIIAGMVLNTIFLVREIRRNEQHDSFINAVTHELKTPIASIRLYLETLKSRTTTEEQRREFYDIMLADADRLHHTVDQVLKAGVAREKRQMARRIPVDVAALARECVDLAVLRHHLHPGSVALEAHDPGALVVLGDAEELRTVIGNLLDNAVKYSGTDVRITVSV